MKRHERKARSAVGLPQHSVALMNVVKVSTGHEGRFLVPGLGLERVPHKIASCRAVSSVRRVSKLSIQSWLRLRPGMKSGGVPTLWSQRDIVVSKET